MNACSKCGAERDSDHTIHPSIRTRFLCGTNAYLRDEGLTISESVNCLRRQLAAMTQRVEKAEAMLRDVAEARRVLHVGYTGGGEPAIYYDTDCIGEALAGLGQHAFPLTAKKEKS